MKKFIFLLLILVQVYAEIITDLRWSCPKPDYNKDCDCYDDFTGLDTCKGDDICCYDYWCGKYECKPPQPICPYPWYPNGCSSTTIGPTCDLLDPSSCLPGEKCCFNGCTDECVFPEQQCPIENDECDDGVTFDCDPNLDDCPKGEECCLIDCNYECTPLEETCPEPTVTCPTSTTPVPPVPPVNICYDYNNDFDECPGDQLCCYNGCGEYSCIEADFGCAYDYYYYDCDYGCLDGDGENACPYGFVCCYDGCEYVCVEPEYYKVSCPNDSIIEHEDVWTKFCLNDCNCPDYQLCCDSPCDCDLNICRDFVVQTASCPDYCDYDYYYYGGYCNSDEDCIWNNQLCCECFWYNGLQCVDPVYGSPEPPGSVYPLPFPLPSD